MNYIDNMKRYIILVLLAMCLVTSYAIDFNWYSQSDARWKYARMGSRGGGSIGKSGCVLSCLTMLLNGDATNTHITPDALNTWLRQNSGYYGNNMRWEIASLYDGPGSGIELKAQDNSRNNWKFLSDQLAMGRKVIVKVAGRRSHWVLVVKQDGPFNVASSYIVNDPGQSSYKPRTLGYWGGFRSARSYSGNWINENAFSLLTDIVMVPVQNEEYFLYDLYEIVHPADVFVSIRNELQVALSGYFLLALFDEYDNIIETLDYDYKEIESMSEADLIFEIEDANKASAEGTKLKILYSKYYSLTPSLYDTFDLSALAEPRSRPIVYDIPDDEPIDDSEEELE